jgi:hypothetical protein
MTRACGPVAAALKGAAAALAAFAVIGTVTALWPNPLFARSLPAQGFEITLLALQSLLIGVYAALRRPQCSVRKAGLGSVVAFLGIACPTCNKLLLLVFGADALVAHFEPARIYLALAGVAVTALAVWAELRPRLRRPRFG